MKEVDPPGQDRLHLREELWRALRSQFHEISEVPGGFIGTHRFATRIRIMLTARQWAAYVVGRDTDSHDNLDVDAARARVQYALDDLEEAIATMDPDESFLVLDGDGLRGSMRAELPPVPGADLERETEEILRQGGGKWYAIGRDGEYHPFVE